MDKPLNILIIDDDDVDRMTVRRALKATGIDAVIAEATGVAAGLEALRASIYDCVFLDFHLPDGDGLTALKAAREAGVRSPFVVLTGRGDELLAVKLLRAGASDYIPKHQWSGEAIATSARAVTRRHQCEVERAKAEAAMQRALVNGEFMVHYQPLVDLPSGRIAGAEALLRWQHPEHGLLSPAHFLPLAEETGLIVPIGERVLETACRQASAWHAAGHVGLRVAVNLSDRQFRHEGLVRSIEQALRASGLEARYLELELTEDILMQVPNAPGVLEALRATGVQLSIDDFGTGYSSLGRLKNFPIHTLKIDQSFVKEIGSDRSSAAIVETILALARNLEIKVLAEGVETQAQLDRLKGMDCNEIQGFFFSRPLPADEFARLLAVSIMG